ncbi:MAG: DUF6521 family protein [bacterium]|nr:DUF6521 family protein [bacterium]
MDTIEALYILKHSPDKIAEKMKSFIYGFKGHREVSYFDLFLFYSLYSYNPAYIFFDKQMTLQKNFLGNFFIDKTNEAPEIFANFNIDFYQTISISKETIIYGVSNSYFSIDEEMNIHLVKKTVSTKDRVAENIGKLFSSQNTAYLYNFFKVDINAI